MPELSRVLSYHNASVINQFRTEHPEKSPEEAKQIFQDLLSWLWLSEYRAQQQLTTHMIAPLVMLDKMWHCFILHTQDYTDFCQHHFDRYLHHVVEPIGDEYTPPMDELSAYLSDCFDQLGEAWVVRNFPL